MVYTTPGTAGPPPAAGGGAVGPCPLSVCCCVFGATKSSFFLGFGAGLFGLFNLRFFGFIVVKVWSFNGFKHSNLRFLAPLIRCASSSTVVGYSPNTSLPSCAAWARGSTPATSLLAGYSSPVISSRCGSRKATRSLTTLPTHSAVVTRPGPTAAI